MSKEELRIFAERYAHFSNIHTIYRDLLSGHYKPSVNVNANPEEWDISDVSTRLNTAYQERDLYLLRLKTDFLLDPLRSDPRLAELVHKVGLAQ